MARLSNMTVGGHNASGWLRITYGALFIAVSPVVALIVAVNSGTFGSGDVWDGLKASLAG